MSVRLAVRFPLGRYHATAWGTHPNEGIVEWPPSPWRLIRALYATWRERAVDLDADATRSLLTRLAQPPRYWLPPAGAAHSRHYYPDGQASSSGFEGKDLAVDAFLAVDPHVPLVVEWPIDLSRTELSVLHALVARLPHLGRADSICMAEVIEEVPEGLELVEPEQDLHADQPSLPLLTLADGHDPTTPIEDTLEQRPPRLRRDKKALPDGTRFVSYPAPTRMIEPPSPLMAARPRASAMRWSVASVPRPSILAAVAMGHVLRRAALGVVTSAGAAPDALTGRADDGGLAVGHRHAHFLSLDLDDDGLIESLAIWSPDGLPVSVVDRLTWNLRALRGHAHIPDFRPCHLGFEAAGSPMSVLVELVGPHRVWRTMTPFAPRYPEKSRSRRGGDRWPTVVERQVRKELAARGLPEPESVNVVRGRRYHALDYRRHRPERQRLADARRAAHVQLVFPQPVCGPIAIGALSHFGLGLFVPHLDTRNEKLFTVACEGEDG